MAAWLAPAVVAACDPVEPLVVAELPQPASSTTASTTDAARNARLAWFKDAKYGLFIHWGLYAIPAGEWKGKRAPGLGEWIMNRAHIPVREYEQLAKQFNPTRFDANAFVKLAQDAGMKYIVITSKHHDGFALFGSKASNYNVVAATPSAFLMARSPELPWQMIQMPSIPSSGAPPCSL